MSENQAASKNQIVYNRYTLDDLIDVMVKLCSKNMRDEHYSLLLSALHDIVCNDACSISLKEDAIHAWNNAFREKKYYKVNYCIPTLEDESYNLLIKASEIIEYVLKHGMQNECLRRMRNYTNFRSLFIKNNFALKKFGNKPRRFPL